MKRGVKAKLRKAYEVFVISDRAKRIQEFDSLGDDVKALAVGIAWETLEHDMFAVSTHFGLPLIRVDEFLLKFWDYGVKPINIDKIRREYYEGHTAKVK